MSDIYIRCEDVLEGYLGNHRTGGDLWLEHAPTKIRVTGHLNVGRNATNRQIKEARDRMSRELFIQLDALVVKHLRLPRR